MCGINSAELKPIWIQWSKEIHCQIVFMFLSLCVINGLHILFWKMLKINKKNPKSSESGVFWDV